MKYLCPISLVIGKCDCHHEEPHDLVAGDMACKGSCDGASVDKGKPCMPVREAKAWALRYKVEGRKDY
jgi:hypothetical protein